ncbi:MAG: hypothetical protein K2L38_09560, partial [Dysosmobacter sp.]|nr:hypothetical protein [Dysosmobacter sp.]
MYKATKSNRPGKTGRPAAIPQGSREAARTGTVLRQLRTGPGMLPPALRASREPPGRAGGSASSARGPG